MKLNIFGFPFGDSGFSIHTYNLALALHKAGVDVGMEAGPNLPDPKTMHTAIYEMIKKNYGLEDTLMITLPEFWRLKYSDKIKNLVGFGIFEGDLIPRNWYWSAIDSRLKAIFVPSEHTKKAFTNAGVDENKISIVPHGIDPEIFNPQAIPMPGVKDGKFNFLFVGGWRDNVNDRKGLDLALKAFSEEFEEHENVRFIVKINMAYAKPGQNIVEEVKALGLREKRPQISLILSQATSKQLAGLYTASDCFVMPSKAESFCMPVAEALACGLPVITTAYGGQSEYVQQLPDNPQHQLLGIEGLAPATGGINYEQAHWAMPSVDHMRKLMRWWFYNKQKNDFTRNSEFIRQNYSWDNSAKKLIEEWNKFI